MTANFRHIILFISGLISLPVKAMTLSVLPDSVSVITASDKSLQNLDKVKFMFVRYGKAVNQYKLDAVDSLEKELSLGLPADECMAKALFESGINTMGRREFEERILEAYKSQALVIKHKINRYPAIIFDDHLVAYGVTDLEEALIRYQEFLKREISE